MTAELWIVLLAALISVESPKTAKQAQEAIRREGAYGCLQIRQPCLDDVNRVYRREIMRAFGRPITVQDCARSEGISRWVCIRYLTHWGKHYKRTTGTDPTLEVFARMWNGGPYGYKKKATVGYWQRVQSAGEFK